jgi:hypothetical protein
VLTKADHFGVAHGSEPLSGNPITAVAPIPEVMNALRYQTAGDVPARRVFVTTLGRPWAVLAAAAAVLLPWALYLATTLPMDHMSVHWRLAWVGFDLTLAAVFCAAALAGRRHSTVFPDLLLAGAVLLLCDAWFDIATAANRPEVVGAVVEAVVAEVPLALYCLAFARSVRTSARDNPIRTETR